MSRSHNLLIAFQQVDPTKHGGWSGVEGCEGCHLDAAAIAEKIAERTIRESDWCRLFNADGTNSAIDAALEGIAEIAVAGDAVNLYWTGHGTPLPGPGVDEAIDEALVTWDGYYADNRIWAHLKKFRKGVRICAMMDTCFSGGQLRGQPRWFPFLFSRKHRNEEIDATIVHLAACRETESAEGLPTGGVYTLSFCKALQGPMNYARTHALTVERMNHRGYSQRPQMSCYGPEKREAPSWEVFV